MQLGLGVKAPTEVKMGCVEALYASMKHVLGRSQTIIIPFVSLHAGLTGVYALHGR